jgi:hypothetical protein
VRKWGFGPIEASELFKCISFFFFLSPAHVEVGDNKRGLFLEAVAAT